MLLRAPAIVSPAIDASSPWKQQQQHNGLCKNGISADKCGVGVAARYMKSKRGGGVHSVRAAVGGEGKAGALSGVIFEPFVEVQDELSQLSLSFSQSLARQKFSDGCEGALNEQIKTSEVGNLNCNPFCCLLSCSLTMLRRVMPLMVAQKANGGQMTDFIEVETIKKLSEYVSQLRRIGKGHAIWHFDQMLFNGDNVVAAPEAGALVALPFWEFIF